ncbi:MAG: hypothetical protein OXC40_02750, partial [Proteobacteria bacterium]|nr:hypothetical protein [Pseudomonadota bacterium]
MVLFNKAKNILPLPPYFHSTSLKFSTTGFMIHAGIIVGLTLFSGCQDSAVEEAEGTTIVYQAGDNKAIDLDKHSAPIPAGKTTLKIDSRVGSSAINDGSHGIDLVLVVDNSNSMVTYGTTNSSSSFTSRHSKGYFSPQTSAHKLDKAFDVFAQQIKRENIDLNVTLVTAASDNRGYQRNGSGDPDNSDFFTLGNSNASPWRDIPRNEIPRTCIPAMNKFWANNTIEDYYGKNYGNYSFIPAMANNIRDRDYRPYPIDSYNFDKPGNLYASSLVGSSGYYVSKFGESNRDKYHHINCVVESFASLGILAGLINPDQGLQSGIRFNRDKVFRNKNTLKMFVVISDSFSPGPDDLDDNPDPHIDNTRGVLKTIVKSDKLEDTETKFTTQANTTFGRNNVRFYSFSTKGNIAAGKFAKDDYRIERVRQTHPHESNWEENGRRYGAYGNVLRGSNFGGREPTLHGRYYGRSYTRLAKYYGGSQFRIDNNQWKYLFESMFKLQKGTSEAVDTNSYDLALVEEGKVLEV